MLIHSPCYDVTHRAKKNPHAVLLGGSIADYGQFVNRKREKKPAMVRIAGTPEKTSVNAVVRDGIIARIQCEAHILVLFLVPQRTYETIGCSRIYHAVH
ncbi:MAG: hypothetical protein A2945_03745 [Candidatus Liptonbacteria bacterium RIFCSPLOWO2_01_FULL_52_25]|uniref:Uncharacterized protein n=1 Tax=Candidatus Liptonbacteria bacterium RIFCSPLOWO2_01_FULL_52_25 TaxID=1798650 RepID=A0A1G2CGS3_9BACT|nr:MAG: hypothetical protein A2945_03745 [Candidatus Liptonbacteria bacterium RIFCSPLOWO2_01_FULL_52_25]